MKKRNIFAFLLMVFECKLHSKYVIIFIYVKHGICSNLLSVKVS